MAGNHNVRVTNLEVHPGSKLISGTSVHEGRWRRIEAFGDVVFDELTNLVMEDPDMSDFALDDGRVIHGDFRKIQLKGSPGNEVIAYA